MAGAITERLVPPRPGTQVPIRFRSQSFTQTPYSFSDIFFLHSRVAQHEPRSLWSFRKIPRDAVDLNSALRGISHDGMFRHFSVGPEHHMRSRAFASYVHPAFQIFGDTFQQYLASECVHSP